MNCVSMHNILLGEKLFEYNLLARIDPLIRIYISIENLTGFAWRNENALSAFQLQIVEMIA